MSTQKFQDEPVMNSSTSLSNTEVKQDRCTPSSNLECTEDPVEEFHQVMMLLSLLSSINDEGQWMTMIEHCMIPSLERDLLPRCPALNALSILLVQGDETVAVAMANHDIFSSGAFLTEPSLHILMMQDSAGLAGAAYTSMDPFTLGNTPLSPQTES